MKAYLLIAVVIFAVLYAMAAVRFMRRNSPDDLVAVALWAAMVAWGVILL